MCRWQYCASCRGWPCQDDCAQGVVVLNDERWIDVMLLHCVDNSVDNSVGKGCVREG